MPPDCAVDIRHVMLLASVQRRHGVGASARCDARAPLRSMGADSIGTVV